MARPNIITEKQVLEAARGVFLEKGFRATTAEVAKRAGIAEGSIFNRFKTKHELFSAAMGLDAQVDPAWMDSLVKRVGAGEIQQTLVQVALEILDFLRSMMPLIMMSWSNPSPSGLPSALAGPNPLPLRALKKIAAFLEAEMRAGRLRRHDPEIAARALLGGLQNYVFFELFLKAQDELPLPREMFVRGLIQILFRGLSPEGAHKKG